MRLGLKWKGRTARCEEAGLATAPPGKMFRTESSRKIPLSNEERHRLLQPKQGLRNFQGESSESNRNRSGGDVEGLRVAAAVANGVANILGAVL